MTDEQTALARRAVACKGWRWMRGMSNDRGQTIDCVDVQTGRAYSGEWDADKHALPDLTDPATLGCLLALVREASRELFALIECKDGGWEVYGGHCDFVNFGNTEAEALVAALEAAPCGR